MGSLEKAAVALLVGLIDVYRYTLSYVLGRQCRFTPTCSVYARQALQKHGLLRGVWLAVRRVGRCHPWGGAGFDPVPDVWHQHRQKNPK